MSSSDQTSYSSEPTKGSSGATEPDDSAFDWKTAIEKNAEQIRAEISQLRREQRLQDRQIRDVTFSLSAPEETPNAQDLIFTRRLQFSGQTDVYLTVAFEPEAFAFAALSLGSSGPSFPSEFDLRNDLFRISIDTEAALCCGPTPRGGGPGPGEDCYCKPCYEV